MRQVKTIALVVVGLCVLSVALSARSARSENITIAVLGKSLIPYWDVVKTGAERAGKELGIKIAFYAPTSENVPAQLQTLDQYIGQGVSGIIFAPSDPSASIPFINKAIDKGIPLITIDTDAPESKRLAYLGTDNYQAGKTAGYVLLEAMKEKGIDPKGAKIATLIGSLSATNCLERLKGETEVLEAAGCDMLSPLNDKENPTTAFSLASSCLASNPDLKGALGVYAYDGPAFARALKLAGRAGTVPLVEFDATKENVEPIKDGTAYATLAQRQYLMGYEGVKLIYNMIKNGWDNALKSLIPEYPNEKIYDTGIDVVGLNSKTIKTPDGDIKIYSLNEYAKELDSRGEPRDWEV